MKTFKNQAAQGDLLIRRVKPENGNNIIAHSETGHHHWVATADTKFYRSEDPMVCYLEVKRPTKLLHDRSFDQHDPIDITEGFYELRRQREHTPEGWRRIED